jgi:cytochrome c-type biogenesis protein CcmH
MMRLLHALALALLLAGPALAAVGDPAEQLPDPAQEERARTIGRELRCMVCQNQSIEDSDADLARDLRRIVREQVAAGRTEAQVIDYLHDRYGDFVLLRPPFTLSTALLWGMPVIALLGGGLLILAMRRRAPTATPAELTEAERARLSRIEDGPDRSIEGLKGPQA